MADQKSDEFAREQNLETDDSPRDVELEHELELDQPRFNRYVQELTDNENLFMGVVGGLLGAGLGAALWAGIVVVTNYQLGLIAIVVGVMAGYGVRILGKGYSQKFQVLGGVLALVGCGAGNLLAALAALAKHTKTPFLDVLQRFDPGRIPDLMSATFSAIDLLFYGIAIYEGYKFAANRIPEEKLAEFVIPKR